VSNSLDRKLRVGILGATGMVGQRFVSLLTDHPWFEVVTLAASPDSAGKTYQEATRWGLKSPLPQKIGDIPVKAVREDFGQIVKEVDLVFSALSLDKDVVKKIEEDYAAAGIVVISNNSAHRWTEDIPLIIPEINPDHLANTLQQQKNRGWGKGCIVVKPNCSLQSYLPVIYALKSFCPKMVSVTTLQAISGAGKTFDSYPDIHDNCIPFIKGEEYKTEKEPLKIWGVGAPSISATCIRVPVLDGHMASVSVKFEKKPSLEQIQNALTHYSNPIADLQLPSAPKQFLHYIADEDRPQSKLDRDTENGMGITCGRFREDPNADWKFISLSHNTIRGAAGGAILIAELLYRKYQTQR
jgi:aspartate-semialdehyde dehydrogenase